MTKNSTKPPILPAAAVADLLVALGTIARLAGATTIRMIHDQRDARRAASAAGRRAVTRVNRMRTVLAAVGIEPGQTPRERVASVRRACSRRRQGAA